MMVKGEFLELQGKEVSDISKDRIITSGHGICKL